MQQTHTMPVEELNRLNEKEVKELVASSETAFQNRIRSVAKEVAENRDQYGLVMISGPTGSAKTSTAGLVAEELTQLGVENVTVNLDDFYLNRNQMAVLEDGSLDLESVECLDVPLIKRSFFNLIHYHRATLPLFDCASGTRSETPRNVELHKGGVLVVEGIHALNPKIADDNYGRRALKLFVEPMLEYTENGSVLIDTTDLRLLRRMPRDAVSRDSNPDKVLRIWKNVLRSEPEKILPYRALADRRIDSSFAYELALYTRYVRPMLEESLRQGSVYEKKMQELYDKLGRCTVSLSIEQVPPDSVMREFIMA